MAHDVIKLTGDITGDATGTGLVSTSVKSDVTLPGNPITTTQASTDNSTRIATTAFTHNVVDAAIAGVNPAVAVDVATAAVLPSTPTYNNGTSGVGATLTASDDVALVLDTSYTVLLGDRVLVKDQAAPAHNGVYTQTQLGNGSSTPYILTRAVDFDEINAINRTGAIPVVHGATLHDTTWVMTSHLTSVGSEALTFTEFSFAPSSVVTDVTSSGGTLTPTSPSTTVRNLELNLAHSNTFSVAQTINGIFTTGSGRVRALREVVASGAITVTTADDIILVNKSSGAATVVNLDATPTKGRTYVIIDGKGDAYTNNITITPNSGNINNAATFVINTAYAAVNVTYDGAQWRVH